MATTMTLSALMTAIRQRADMLPTGYAASLSGTDYFVTDVELISYINQSCYELYDLMISCFGANYFVKAPPQAITCDGTAQQALATDFYKLLGVDWVPSTGTAITLKPFTFGDRNRFSPPSLPPVTGRTNLRYRLNGSSLWLTPTPASGTVLNVWYVPRLSPMASLSDTFDGISGWTEYVIVDCAIKCLVKEESDVQVLMAQKAGLTVRIQAMADSRDAGSPATVTDARSGQGWGPDDGSGGW